MLTVGWISVLPGGDFCMRQAVFFRGWEGSFSRKKLYIFISEKCRFFVILIFKKLENLLEISGKL